MGNPSSIDPKATFICEEVKELIVESLGLNIGQKAWLRKKTHWWQVERGIFSRLVLEAHHKMGIRFAAILIILRMNVHSFDVAIARYWDIRLQNAQSSQQSSSHRR